MGVGAKLPATAHGPRASSWLPRCSRPLHTASSTMRSPAALLTDRLPAPSPAHATGTTRGLAISTLDWIMGSGQAGSPDAGADVAQDGSSYGWKEKLQQRQMAAQAVSGGSASAVGGGSGSSGGSSDAFWYMRSDGQSTSLNYFIPIGGCWLGGWKGRGVEYGLGADGRSRAPLTCPPGAGHASALMLCTYSPLCQRPQLLSHPPPSSGVMLGLVTLACLFVGFWWRRRLERTRRLRAAEQPADPEQGGLPRCSLGEEQQRVEEAVMGMACLVWL